MSKVYLIFLPAGKSARLPYRIHVLDASRAGFSPGSAVYFNLSQRNIAGKLGTRALKLRPGASQKLKGNPGERYYVDIRYHQDDRWLPLCKSYWEDDPSFRQVVLIYDDPKSRRTRFLSIADRVPQD